VTNEIYSLEYECKDDMLLDLTVGSCRYEFLFTFSPKPASSSNTCNGTCPGEEVFSKFKAVADYALPTQAADGYFSVTLTDEFWLSPGDFLGFSGPGIGYRYLSWIATGYRIKGLPHSNATAQDADFDGDSAERAMEEDNGLQFHLEVIAFQPTFYDIGNTCTEAEAATVITATVTGGDDANPKTNETACQVRHVYIRNCSTQPNPIHSNCTPWIYPLMGSTIVV
jgi:hypothetical protein